ncbi:MAG: hypothetical protein NUW01_04665 [Gemmatimonadaceae bacterium]|nr:hypothetical protein [Gemmatimonadaceae bacterium]
MTTEAITLSISYTRKINLGNYESADVFFAVSGIPVGAGAEEIADALVTGALAYEQVKAAVAAKAQEIKAAARTLGGQAKA